MSKKIQIIDDCDKIDPDIYDIFVRGRHNHIMLPDPVLQKMIELPYPEIKYDNITQNLIHHYNKLVKEYNNNLKSFV